VITEVAGWSALLLRLPEYLVEKLCLTCEAYATEEERHTGLRAAPPPTVLARYLLARALERDPREVAMDLHSSRCGTEKEVSR
jgi:hypothetical protein